MKITVLTLLTVFSFAYGQQLANVEKSIHLLTNTPDFKLDSTGISKLNKPECYCEEWMSEEGTNRGNAWHVADLNHDGLDDLIYSGPCAPYLETVIYINRGESFEKVYGHPGKLLAIDANEKGSDIYILKNSCCCDNYNKLQKIAIRGSGVVDEHYVYYHFETNPHKSRQMSDQNLSGMLRTSPFINDLKTKNPCTDEEITGNQLRKLDEENVVVLFSRNEWLLVMAPDGENRSMIGWVNKQE